MQKTCEHCQETFETTSKRARYCSDKCRIAASRHREPVSVKEGKVKMEDRVYRFKTFLINKETGEKEYSPVRTARTWVDVPLNGVPVREEGWPEKPDYMDNRQYYLWWDNHFKTDKGTPVITNPHPKYEKTTFEKGGEQSRRWGS